MKSKALQPLDRRAAGIDIGAEQHFVAVPDDIDEPVRCFDTFTTDLHELVQWLKDCRIDTVAMESTGVYWIPIYEMLEQAGFEVLLVNAHHVKNVPGRKTDVLDCQWIQQLHSYGLLRGAFRPDDTILPLRAYMRQRANLVRYAGMHIQHMQKALDQMNIQLHHVVSDITGLTGSRILTAILGGERDPRKLAALRDSHCRHSEEEIAKALTGNWRPEHLFELKQGWELYQFYQQQILACDREIEQAISALPTQTDEPAPPPDKPKRSGANKNALSFEVRDLLYGIAGVDLTGIDGLQEHTVLKILAETGTDMSRWPTEKHFAAWLGLCPGNKVSGGKRLSGKTTPSANRAAAAFRMATQGLHHSQSALGAYYRRMRARLGGPKAVTATAHKLCKLFYNMLKYGSDYHDAGAEYYEQQYRDRVLRNLRRQAKNLGFELAELPQSA